MSGEEADGYAAAFEAFVQGHPLVVCILLAWVVSWTLTVTFRPLIRAALPDKIERSAVRLFDVIIAGAVAAYMWPGDDPYVWGAAIGGTSPFAYLALSEALCWKWPALRGRLSLRDLTEPEPNDDKGSGT